MDREFSDELTALMPSVPHRLSGVNCSGSIVAAVEGGNVELHCNHCGAVVGVVQVGIMEGLLGLDCPEATCPHCGVENMIADLVEVAAYICKQCGKVVQIEGEGY
jgi:hypothetical protein